MKATSRSSRSSIISLAKPASNPPLAVSRRRQSRAVPSADRARGQHPRDAGLIHALADVLGAAILPCLLADDDPELVRLLPPEKVVSVELWLVVHRDLIRTARVRAVMDFLTAVCPKTTALHRDRARMKARR